MLVSRFHGGGLPRCARNDKGKGVSVIGDLVIGACFGFRVSGFGFVRRGASREGPGAQAGLTVGWGGGSMGCMEQRRNDQKPHRSNRSYGTDRTYAGGVIPAHGGYRGLKSYQSAEIIYDATVAFCARFVDRRSRTTDQMVQAARSGKQNIAEGSQASGTSKKTELKLVSVARASLEELLLDYQDFLRQRSLALWAKDHAQAQAIRKLAYARNRSYGTYRTYVEQASPEVAANVLICLIHQANYLLDRQLRQLKEQFLAEGGFTERLYHARKRHRRSTGPGGSGEQ